MLAFLVVYVFAWVLSIFFVPVRLVLMHPFLTVKYALIDSFYYFKYKKWNNFVPGKFVCFDANGYAVFGSGKTLSGVFEIRRIFRKYNDKLVFDIHSKSWKLQKIHILTNLTLNNLPFEKLTNLGQIIQCCEKMQNIDAENGTLTCIVVLIDECQNQMHSRTFKDNLSPMMLKALTECRHFNMSIYYDAPRFKQVDALLRQCTAENIKNHKIWRFQCQSMYDANDIENANNPELVKPYWKKGFFIENDLFEEYDTKEIIENLVKAKERGDFLSDEEILALQCNQQSDIDAIAHKSKKALRVG